MMRLASGIFVVVVCLGLLAPAVRAEKPCCEPPLAVAPAQAPAGEVYVRIDEPPRPMVCRHKRSDAEADVEELRAVNVLCTPQIRVKYEIEIEDACPCERFELRLRVRDKRGVLLETRIPLDEPAKVDDDEQIYKGTFDGLLGQAIMGKSRHFKVEATVINCATGERLERETERVKQVKGERIVTIQEGAVIQREEIMIQPEETVIQREEIVIQEHPLE